LYIDDFMKNKSMLIYSFAVLKLLKHFVQ
jgi:hypothetical protein